MRAEIEFLQQATAPNSKIRWSMPIGHLIKRDHNWQCHLDACLRSGGGYSIDLNFIWFLLWQEPFVQWTLLYLKDDQNKDIISINIWEFILVIMNYCAILVTIETDGRTEDPSPVLLAWCDNTSTVNWITHAEVGSTIGRALGRLFCALLINSPLGINAKWLSTLENEVVDEISCLKKLTIQAADCSSECPVESKTNIGWDHLFQSFP
jgi:hypothetical protein